MAMTAYDRVDHVPSIRYALTDVHQVCTSLDLMKGSKRQAGGGLLICCPQHGERNASCSVTLGPDGTLRVRCFSCQFSGDVFHLVAATRGLDVARDFRAVLEEAAQIAGLYDVLDDIRGTSGGRERVETPAARPKPLPPPDPRTYPAAAEVKALWEATTSVDHEEDVAAWLRSRGINPIDVARHDLARALHGDVRLPWWASYRGDANASRSWVLTGHKLIFPVYDARGAMRSVRGARVTDGDSPKRLPPAGHLATGLVLANPEARALLSGARYPVDLLIVEGEPDFLTWAAREKPVGPIIGVGSGWWSKRIADRIAAGSRVIIRTHQDDAGDRYAVEVARTVALRCVVLRPGRPEQPIGDENDQLRGGLLPERADDGAAPMVVDVRDPRSFMLGRIFADYYWLGDEIKPGVFAARCPSESLHHRGTRFDGSTVVKAPDDEARDGSFRCSHEACRGIYGAIDSVVRAMERIASGEGL